MIAAKTAAVRVERKLAGSGNQIAVGNKRAAFALLAEAKILDLHQHGDCEAVVNRDVLDVCRPDSGLFERARPRPGGAGEGEIEVLAAIGALRRLARSDDLDPWSFQLARDLRTGDDQRSPAVGYHTTVQPMEGIGDHR